MPYLNAFTDATINTKNNQSAMGIHKGDKTHHHDHAIEPTSFNTTKIVKRVVVKLNPVSFIPLIY